MDEKISERSEEFDPEIDYQYSPSNWASRKDAAALFVDRVTKYSEKFRSSLLGAYETVRYGEGPKQIMEIVKPQNLTEETSVFFFIHGGYWVETSREMYFFATEPAYRKGWIGVNVGYDQAPEVSLTTIVDQIRDAYVFLSKRFPNCKKMTVAGHSAGGHLAAMLLSTDWTRYCPGEKNVLPITKCVPLCGILDIRPVVHMSYNEQLHLTKKETQELSPLLNVGTAVSNIKTFGTKIISVAGEADPPSFRQKAKEYTQALTEMNVDAKYVGIEGLDHFEVLEKLSDSSYELHKLLFDGEDV